MNKQFCDNCDREIPSDDLYFDVLVQVKLSEKEDDQNDIAQEYADFCYKCATSGEALKLLMEGLRANNPELPLAKVRARTAP